MRELLANIPATSVTEPPLSAASSFIKELGTESGLTPLHMAAYSGEENVVRLLLNIEGVQVDAPTANLVCDTSLLTPFLHILTNHSHNANDDMTCLGL